MENWLNYRRQFLLTSEPINGLANWNYFKLDSYHLYAHPDVNVSHANNSLRTIIIIGNIYDYNQPEKTNADISEDIIANADNFEEFVLWMKRYAGRYAVLYKDEKQFVALPDALALREIYYCTKKNLVICGSQPNLLNAFSTPKLGITTNAELINYYNTHKKGEKWNPDLKWIGDETIFNNVMHLLPNHCFDIQNLKAKRFWPNKNIDMLCLEDAVLKGCSILEGNLKSMVLRHPVMMAVTAGTDTRTLLAASKEVKDKIYYFVNNENLGQEHPDIYIPKKIFNQIALPFNIHEVPLDVDEDFKNIFLNNCFFACERILPTIYNIYFKKHSDKVNILGIGEIGRTRFGKEPRKITGHLFAYKLGYEYSGYPKHKSDEILSEMLPDYKKYGVNVLTGLYWEQMLGNWGTTGNSESDIAIEEVNPYNSYELYELFLGVDGKYTKYTKNILFENMILKMWPEVLNFPINPPYSLRSKIKKIFKKLNLYILFKDLKYQFSYLMYSLKS